MVMKLGAAQRRLLVEALRRYVTFHRGESLTEAWTGLGTKTQYKAALDAGLMRFVHKYPPRCSGWLKLTERGAAIVQGWLDDGYSIEDAEAGRWPGRRNVQ